MSKERITVPTIHADDKRKKALRKTLTDLRKFQRKILDSRGGRPLPDSVSDLTEIREGR